MVYNIYITKSYLCVNEIKTLIVLLLDSFLSNKKTINIIKH